MYKRRNASNTTTTSRTRSPPSPMKRTTGAVVPAACARPPRLTEVQGLMTGVEPDTASSRSSRYSSCLRDYQGHQGTLEVGLHGQAQPAPLSGELAVNPARIRCFPSLAA